MNKAVAVLMLIVVSTAIVVLTWNVLTKPQAENTSPIYVVPTAPKHHSSGGSGGGSTVIGPAPSPTETPTNSKLFLFSDESATQPLKSLDWGSVSMGGNCTRTVYIKNEENGAIAAFLVTPNWKFFDTNGQAMNSTEYEQYFNITWDSDNVVIDQDSVVGTNFVLSVSPNLPINSVHTFTAQLSLSYEKP